MALLVLSNAARTSNTCHPFPRTLHKHQHNMLHALSNKRHPSGMFVKLTFSNQQNFDISTALVVNNN